MTMTKAPKVGPACAKCGAGSMRAVRTRSLSGKGERIFYMSFLWACTTCDNVWTDAMLEGINARSARSAQLMARRRNANVEAQSA